MYPKRGSAPNPAKGTLSLWNPVMYNKLGADITVGTFFAAYANSPKANKLSGCLFRLQTVACRLTGSKKVPTVTGQHPLALYNGVWGLVPSGVWGGAPF